MRRYEGVNSVRKNRIFKLCNFSFKFLNFHLGYLKGLKSSNGVNLLEIIVVVTIILIIAILA
ncbi:MAG: prepilin-type N-terminal cleavage/methylation domain-containing protein, partial [Candidatus Omnitrophica bacterium]|nr:prepilin-type N-terminal cleavage/methylation domain-containing protein [Candidatus Omnitrophota bacterium]